MLSRRSLVAAFALLGVLLLSPGRANAYQGGTLKNHSHSTTAGQGGATLAPSRVTVSTINGPNGAGISSATILNLTVTNLNIAPGSTALLSIPSSSTYMANVTSTASYNSINSNGWTIVSSGTFAAVGGVTISNLQPSQFDYDLRWNGLQNTAGGNWTIRFNNDAGANHQYVSHCDNGAAANAPSSLGGSGIVIDESGNTIAASGQARVAYSFGALQSSVNAAQGDFHLSAVAVAGTISHCDGEGNYSGASAVSTISLLTSAGTMTGNWKLLALPK